MKIKLIKQEKEIIKDERRRKRGNETSGPQMMYWNEQDYDLFMQSRRSKVPTHDYAKLDPIHSVESDPEARHSVGVATPL